MGIRVNNHILIRPTNHCHISYYCAVKKYNKVDFDGKLNQCSRKEMLLL